MKFWTRFGISLNLLDMKIIACSIFIFSMSVAKDMSTKCNEPKLKKYIKLDYKAFDQSPPDGGWRALQVQGQELQIAEVIDYYLKCRSGLTNEQKATLVFHAGQIYGDLGKNNLAIERMKQAYDDTLDKKYHWNSYIEGSIAFLERDLKKLKAARDKVQAAEADHPYVETLSDLVRCYHRPYKEFASCRNEKPAPTHQVPAAVR